MGIKDTVKEWAWETWDEYVKKPIAKKTEELEGGSFWTVKQV